MLTNPVTNRVPRRRATLIGTSMLVLVAVIVVGLATSSTSAGSTSAGVASAKSATGSATGLQLAAQRLKAYYNGSSFGKPPTTAPLPQPGKKVWAIVFGLGAPAGASWGSTLKEAGALMGWKVTVYDGQFTNSRYLDGVRLAIAAKADAIILVGFDCAPVQSALQQARKLGIKIAGVDGVDCGAQKPGAPFLFDANITYQINGKPGTYRQFTTNAGRAQADWIAVNTKGKGQVILTKNTDAYINVLLYNGFVAELKAVCPGCKILQTVPFVSADLFGSGLSQKVQVSIAKNPTANVIVFPFDDVLYLGGTAAINASGRGKELLVVAGSGEPAALDLMRKGKGLDASYGWSFGWESYATIDSLNRLFNGQKLRPSGMGLGMIDKTHNLPPSGEYRPPVNYKALYQKAWKSGK